MAQDEKVFRLHKKQPGLLSDYKADRIKHLVDDVLDEQERDLFGEALQSITKTRKQYSTWRFVMLEPEHFRVIAKLIKAETRSLDTSTLWQVITTYLDWNTGEVMVDRKTLISDCEMDSSRISKSFKQLVDLGALYRRKKTDGKFSYFVNPNVCWRGTEEARQKTVAEVVQLDLFRLHEQCAGA